MVQDHLGSVFLALALSPPMIISLKLSHRSGVGAHAPGGSGGVVRNRLILGNTGVRKSPADDAGCRSDRLMSRRRRPASPTHAR